MIQSTFVTDLLELSFDGIEEYAALKAQVPYLTEDDCEYTGVGVYISFRHEAGIAPHQFRIAQHRMECVQLESPEFEGIADVMIVVSEGFIDYIEIWAQLGVYPLQELQRYMITQTLPGTPSRRIIR